MSSMEGKVVEEHQEELCGSYLFLMPHEKDIDRSNDWNDLVLLERDPLFKEHMIVLHFPLYSVGPRNIALLKVEWDRAAGSKEDAKRTLVQQMLDATNSNTVSFPVEHGGNTDTHYELVLINDDLGTWTPNQKISIIATFTLDADEISNRRAATASILVILAILLAVTLILCYIQYQRVKKIHKVDPPR